MQVGDAIEEGQPLVLLEAMKMENELRSMRAGIVKSVLVDRVSASNRMHR